MNIFLRPAEPLVHDPCFRACWKRASTWCSPSRSLNTSQNGSGMAAKCDPTLRARGLGGPPRHSAPPGRAWYHPDVSDAHYHESGGYLDCLSAFQVMTILGSRSTQGYCAPSRLTRNFSHRWGVSGSVHQIPSARRILNVGIMSMAVRMATDSSHALPTALTPYKACIRSFWFAILPRGLEHQSCRLSGAPLTRSSAPSCTSLVRYWLQQISFLCLHMQMPEWPTIAST